MSFRRFKSLLLKSAQIDVQIEREHKRTWPDWLRLLKLKKLRLMIKDRIEKIILERSGNKYSGVMQLRNVPIDTRKY